MTAARQKQKRHGGWLLSRLLPGLYACLCVGVLLALAPAGARAAVTERIVVDWYTGLAIGGYDPVAYFTDGKPQAGSGEFELQFAGAVWRFLNPGNRAAFAGRPDVYMPQFGGYDPTGVARGVAASGKANIWLIVGQRLFLFYDQAGLEKFAADPARVFAAAQRQWPSVLNTLSP